MTSRRRGFTLVELLVALVIGLLAIVAAAALLRAAMLERSLIISAFRAVARDANRHRWLSATLAGVDVDTTAGGEFVGTSRDVAFDAWLETPARHFVRRRVELRVDDNQLRARVEGSDILLADAIASASFDYLLVPGERARWAARWTSGATPPVALRLRIAYDRNGASVVDTVLYRIGRLP